MCPSIGLSSTHNAFVEALFSFADEPWLYGVVGFRFLLPRMGLYR